MKYNQFLELKELVETIGYDSSNIPENIDPLLEKSPADALSLLKALNNKKVILDVGRDQVAVTGPNGEIMQHLPMKKFQNIIASNPDVVKQFQNQQSSMPVADIANSPVGTVLDPAKMKTIDTSKVMANLKSAPTERVAQTGAEGAAQAGGEGAAQAGAEVAGEAGAEGVAQAGAEAGAEGAAQAGAEVAGEAGAEGAASIGGSGAVTGLAKGIIAIKTSALLTGVVGVGIAAFIAWLFRRQIINLVWMKKLSNNSKKVQKSLAAIIQKHGADMLKNKDKLIQKLSAIDQAEAKEGGISKSKENVADLKKRSREPGAESPDMKKKASPEVKKESYSFESKLDRILLLEDENAKRRIAEAKAQIQKAIAQWDEKFVSVIDNAIDQSIEGKTKELNLRIDDLKQLKPGQKVALKNVWAMMMVNLKAEVWKLMIGAKVISSEDVISDVNKGLETEQTELKKSVKDLQKELDAKYSVKVKDIQIGENKLKYGRWYLFEKEGDDSVAGNKYIKFDLDEEAITEGKEAYKATVIEVVKDEKTGSLKFMKKAIVRKESELLNAIKKAGIKEDSETFDLEKMKKEVTRTPEQEKALEDLKQKIKQGKLDAAKLKEAAEKIKNEKDPEKKKKMDTAFLKRVGVTAAILLATNLILK